LQEKKKRLDLLYFSNLNTLSITPKHSTKTTKKQEEEGTKPKKKAFFFFILPPHSYILYTLYKYKHIIK
jgi:hypothetical protein